EYKSRRKPRNTKRGSSEEAYVIELPTQYRLRVGPQPFVEYGSVHGAEVDLHPRVAAAVQISNCQRGLPPVDMPTSYRVAYDEHHRGSAVVGPYGGILLRSAAEL